MKLYIILIIIYVFNAIIALGCKKERLNDDKTEHLIGHWIWKKTIRSDFWSYTPNDTVTPQNSGHEFALKFKKQGKVSYFTDGLETESYNMRILGVTQISESHIIYSISLWEGIWRRSKQHEYRTFECKLDLSNQELRTGNFPFNSSMKKLNGDDWPTNDNTFERVE